MEKSPKSPKFTESTATYVISAHGTMLTSMLGTPQTKKYHAINIPENFKIYTIDALGECVAGYNTQTDVICKIYKETLQLSHTLAFKFIHEDGKTNKFPELFLTSDKNIPSHGYKGITHCIPEKYRTSSASRGKEVIYNIDAKNTEDCKCSSIVSISTTKPYDCNKNYSDYYKKQLESYIYDPTSTSINKCGPILMSEAIQIIKSHCNSFYKPTCVIKIYVFACLVETDLKTLDSFNWKKYVEAYRNALKSSTSAIEESLDTTSEVSESEKNLIKYYYYEQFMHNTSAKVNFENVVNRLTDFNAISLIKSHLSSYRFVIKHKIFDIITYKDVYKEFTIDLLEGISGTLEQVIAELEKKYRARHRRKLDNSLLDALQKLKLDDSDNDLAILPEFNKIDLVHKSINTASESEVIDTIYRQLKELIKIEKQKLNMGQGRRKKTLRTKYKKQDSRRLRLRHAKQINKTTRRNLH